MSKIDEKARTDSGDAFRVRGGTAAVSLQSRDSSFRINFLVVLSYQKALCTIHSFNSVHVLGPQDLQLVISSTESGCY